VWVSVRGAASTGPLADAPSFDLLAQARSGLMSVTGSPQGPPTKVGAPVADVVTGLYAAAALLAGLYARQATGRAARFEVPLLEATVTALVNQAQGYLVTGRDPGRLGNDHPNIAPYGPYPTRDGALIVAAATTAQFRALCAALGDPALAADARFATNASRVASRDALDEALRDAFAARSAGEWAEVLVDAGVPCGPVHTVASAIEDPQVRGGGLVATASTSAGEFEMLRSPILVDGSWLPVRRSPPALDQDGSAIRAALGEPP
jgi:crotonobetainyl-CoA:carnitine CoA-transferase CaiB-like acyl-CoA transferase